MAHRRSSGSWRPEEDAAAPWTEGRTDLRFSPAHLMFRVFHFKLDVSIAEELRHAARHAQARLELLQGPFKDLESPGVWRRGRTDLI